MSAILLFVFGFPTLLLAVIFSFSMGSSAQSGDELNALIYKSKKLKYKGEDTRLST